MNIQKLEVGMKVKYKELCELLGIEPKEGNSRKAQFKEIDKLIGYHKEGQLFIIDEIKAKRRRLGNKKTVQFLHRINHIDIIKNINSITSRGCKNCTEIEDNKPSNAIYIRKAPWRDIEQELIDRREKEEKDTTKPSKYYESKDDDLIFDNIMANKRNLKVYHYYTYKQLCEILNIPYVEKGNGKEKILSFIEQQVCLLKEKNKYKILRIYKTALPRNNVSLNNATMYGDTLCLALVKWVLDNPSQLEFLDKHNYLYFSKNTLAQEMYLCNEKFKEFNSAKGRKELSEKTGVSIECINDFYYHTDTQMKSSVKKGLKNLQGRRTIRFNDSETSIVISFENGYKRLATYEEIGAITNAEKKVKKQMGITNLSYLIMNGRMNEFYDKVEKYIRVQAEQYNPKYRSLKDIDYYYKSVTIFTTLECLQMGFIEFIENIENSLRVTNDTFIGENLNYYNNKKNYDNTFVIADRGFGIEEVRDNKEQEFDKLKMEYLQGIYLLYELLCKKKPTFGAYKETMELINKLLNN